MNPIIWRQGVCDPHAHVFNEKVYIYATHDSPCRPDNFRMQDWQIWSSEDLINWKLEQTLYPEDFHCGALDQCWAVDAAEKDGKYYWYFSTGDWGVGVGVSDYPQGPFVDALGDAMVDYRTEPVGIPKWDPCVFQDEDGSAYLIVGDCRTEDSYAYLIGKISDDMIHMAEPLRKIEYRGNICPEDKASIHKYNGKYYLTHSSSYAVSDCVYGPYEYVGNTGCNVDHGSYFTYKNQTYFTSGGMDNPNRYYRASYIAPCHYRKNGEIVIDQEVMAYGSGQYDATMPKISAAWYFDAASECKIERTDGVFVSALRNGDFLGFPNISNVEENAVIRFRVAAVNKSVSIIVREQDQEGRILGTCKIEPANNWEEYQEMACSLNNQAGNLSLYFTIEGEEAGEILYMESFYFEMEKESCSVQPALSSIGRGAILEAYEGASWGNVLKNLNLKNTFLEAVADGGSGGNGVLEVYYVAKADGVELNLTINGAQEQMISFAGMGEKIEKISLPISLKAGLNRIRLENKRYQEARLAIDHLVVSREKEFARTYSAANGQMIPRGNGCWDGFPQRENDTEAYTGRVVKYLQVPGHGLVLEGIDGAEGGIFKMIFHYARGEEGESCYQLKVNNIILKETLKFPKTEGSSLRQGGEHTVEVELKPGENILELVKVDRKDDGIFLDGITVLR